MWKAIIAVAVLFAMSPDLALADVQGAAAQRNLTTTKRVVMPKPVNGDPLLVSQLLAIDERDRRPPGESEDSRLPPAQPSAPIDPQRHMEVEPDLRTSPEAAHDLFQLLKKADPKQASKPKQ
jgi:hypothetical protein